MNKLIVLAVALLLVFSVFTGCGTVTGEVVKVEKDVVKVGFMVPQTGPLASVGYPVEKSLLLALDQINMGGKKIEIVVEDSRCNPSEAAIIANKFVNVDKVDVIVTGICSSVALAVAPIAEANKIIHITPVAASPKITYAGDYVFRISASSRLAATEAAKLISSHEIKTVGVIYENNDYPIGYYEVFTEEFEKLGGDVIIAETYDFGSSDMRTQILKVKDAEPEAMLILPIGIPGAAMMLKQIKELEVELPVYGQELVSYDSVVALAGDAADGVTAIMYDFDPEDVVSAEFIAEYELHYGEALVDKYYGAVGYDVLMLLFEGFEVCDGDADCLVEYLSSMESYSGAGGDLEFENGIWGLYRPIQMKTVRNGEFVLVE
ncbi:ABC transporter substrate-binding protein [Candidatus Woesearchaeota archaeon]|nr:ABC transporter substrate-binding protein [Candidatus Woesearchaeota archaeon]MBT3537006.1 ABC transporter substrate-binding protein [Candidatus Woesearchaeota archaeon]MBT4697616.1 ABC transporter substrate-binding protein [Candidatus Woesearchaeota archaeon]MBT4717730.1 ABC transporter substrate-binding protein [Candidatus Woesearchaeota archaeon]MBT7106684.1 ABC transporter substrate-binding protein [Candidatus Woesearchaeota archaeon]